MVDGGSGADVRRSSTRRPFVVAAVLIVLVLVAAAAIAWPAVASTARRGISVREDARPWICSSGSTVTEPEGGDVNGDPEYVSLAVVTKDLHCRLRLVIENTGSHTVTVDGLVFPLFGPGTAANVVGTQLDGDFSTVRDSSGSHDPDARFRIPGGVDIEPGSSYVVAMTVVYHDKGAGCSLSAGSAEYGGDVTLAVRSLGLAGTVRAGSNWFGLTTPKGACA
jgi:hypothetical protein